MTEKKKRRSDERFEREAKALQKNLEKRKLQQQSLEAIRKQKEKQDGQTKN